MVREGGGTSPWRGSEQCAVENPPWSLCDAAQMWGSQRLRGYKIYSLSIFLFLFYPIKTVILLSHFGLGLSY